MLAPGRLGADWLLAAAASRGFRAGVPPVASGARGC